MRQGAARHPLVSRRITARLFPRPNGPVNLAPVRVEHAQGGALKRSQNSADMGRGVRPLSGLANAGAQFPSQRRIERKRHAQVFVRSALYVRRRQGRREGRRHEPSRGGQEPSRPAWRQAGSHVFAFGDVDCYSIVDLPDNVSAAALSFAVNESGAISIKTVVLLTPEEVDAAVKKKVKFRAPGH